MPVKHDNKNLFTKIKPVNKYKGIKKYCHLNKSFKTKTNIISEYKKFIAEENKRNNSELDIYIIENRIKLK